MQQMYHWSVEYTCANVPAAGGDPTRLGQGSRLLSAAKEELVEAERQLLQQLHGLLEQAMLQIEEMCTLTRLYDNNEHTPKLGD